MTDRHHWNPQPEEAPKFPSAFFRKKFHPSRAGRDRRKSRVPVAGASECRSGLLLHYANKPEIDADLEAKSVSTTRSQHRR
jgi:hypothetical protein